MATHGATTAGLDVSIVSAAVGRPLHYEVFLPAGYDASTKRYPVLYFFHGLPAGSTGYHEARFAAAALGRKGLEAILVAPQGSDDDQPDPEYLDRGGDENWETALTSELIADVDARYRTIASRAGRAVLGVSAGGYGAMLVALHHPDLYAAVQSWSGYFHPTDPSGLRPIDLGSLEANARATGTAQLATFPGRPGARALSIAFYVGAADTRFRAENVAFNQALSRAGVAHVFRLYAGGHTHTLWISHADAWLQLLVRRLATAG
jgi:S-formylglutathione hydrolase FrmB